MLPHTSSYEGEGRRKSNEDIRATIKNTDEETVPHPDNDKRKQHSFDDDLQKPLKKNKPSTPTSKEANGPPRQPFVPYTGIHQVYYRNKPYNLYYALQSLSDAQISAIKDMGFQSILSMDILNLPRHMGYWLLVNYDHNRNELNVGSRRIKITPSKVHEVFGIPMGKITVIEEITPRYCVHPTVDEFRSQYVNRFRRKFEDVKIRIEDVMKKLQVNRDGGRKFKLNFLVIFNTILGKTNKDTTPEVNENFLASIVNDSDISNMDWCSYMISCLNRTMETWKKKYVWNKKYMYSGPITLLAVLYAHECHAHEYQQRHGKVYELPKTPAISYIDETHLYHMERFLHDDKRLREDAIKAHEPRTKSDDPQLKSHNEDVGEVQTISPNEGENDVVGVKTINEDEGEREDEYENQHQSGYQYQDQGDKFQSKEDQLETQGEEEDRTTYSKHHGLNLQVPIDTRVDASSLDDDRDVELLVCKQEQCEFVGNVSPTLDSVEKLSSTQSDIICVQGYKVKRSIATILETIFKKHGDIAANCIFKTSSARTYFLEVVCEVVRRIQTNDVIEKMEEIECQVSDAEAANIDASWLRAHFEAINKRKETSEKHGLLMEMKTKTILVKRAAQMDLRERSVEFMAAQERFIMAERCVQVLHLVEKNLNDSILESKAKIDSWVSHSVV